jgi:hypothetical protein
MSAFCLFTNSAARSVSPDQLSGFIGARPRPAFTAVDFRHWAVIRDVTAQTGFANRQFAPDKVDRSSLALWSEKDGVARAIDQVELSLLLRFRTDAGDINLRVKSEIGLGANNGEI